MMIAFILAGGFGKRLKPLTDKVPKAMIEVGGKPVIYWQIKWLESFGIEEFVLLSGYKSGKITDYIKSIGYSGRFRVSVEKEPLGTGGAIKNAGYLVSGKNPFLVVNGDNVTDIDIRKLNLSGKNLCNISLVPYFSTKGIVVSKRDKVVRFDEKPKLEGYWYNAGVSLVSPSILEMLPDKGSIEAETFPALASKGRLSCTKFDGHYLNSIDSFKDLEQIDRDIRQGRIKV